MFGWKVDVGICPVTKLTNINEVRFTDFNVPFIVPQGNVISTTDGYSGTNPQTAYELIEKYLGNDVNFIYAGAMLYPQETEPNLYENASKLFIAFPSLPLLYPNLWEIAKTYSSVLMGTAYYFKQLNKIYVALATGGSAAVYSVSADGSLSQISTNIAPTNLPVGVISSSTSTTISYGDLRTVFFDKNLDITFDNLISVNSFNKLLLEVYRSNTYVQVDGRTGSLEAVRVFQYLFQDSFVPPDFDIPHNPYEPGGPSGPGGGGGTFDGDSDPITIPSLPTLSSANTGFTRIYNPTLSQVQSLANYLWTDDSVIDTIWNHIKQFFENPMDAIIGFNLVPVPVPDGGIENFKLMYIDTGVSMTVAANQFVDIDCGTLDVKQYYGSALDYSPYTKISCFLPFIGTVNLNVDEVMGKTLSITYRVDICSGSCVAYIVVNGTVLYQYSGHCAISIPLASADFSSYVNAAISVAKLAAAALTAGAGAAAGVGAAEASQQTNQVVTTQVKETARNPITGRQVTTGTKTTVETREGSSETTSTQGSFAGLTPQNVSNTVGAIMSSKPHIEHSGSFSGNSGYLGVRRPFIIIERPNMCMPANYQALNGFPSMITLDLSTCKGFTQVQQVQLTGMSATNPEQAEILQLLKGGVIF